jgi:phenylacetic acid degradation operon negative regulatory protein
MVTLLADYWFSTAGSVPSAALVELVSDFGVSPGGARSALSRLAQRSLIEPTRTGRQTSYRLTSDARRSLRRGGRKVARFGSAELSWDGLWTVVAFSVPEHAREIRPQLRQRLRILGFAPLYDGVWISPRGSADDTWAALRQLGVLSATVLRARHIPAGEGGRAPLEAWDLTGVRQGYDEFIERFAGVHELFQRGNITAQAALNTRTEIMDIWRAFPSSDPQLPDELLPPSWPRRRARDLFAHTYDTMGPLAELRVQQIVGQYAPELVDQVRHLTTTALATDEPEPGGPVNLQQGPASSRSSTA